MLHLFQNDGFEHYIVTIVNNLVYAKEGRIIGMK